MARRRQTHRKARKTKKLSLIRVLRKMRKMRKMRRKPRRKTRQRKTRATRKHVQRRNARSLHRSRKGRACHLLSKPFLIRYRSPSGRKVDRLAVVVSSKDGSTAFYQSTGQGTPGLVKAKTWIPFGGISRKGGGWFIKVPGKVPTGDLKTCADWLANKKLRAERVFDEARYTSFEEHSADVNSLLEKHGALSREAGKFQIGTVNFRPRRK